MLKWALKYQKIGLSVIPLLEKGKEPVIHWKEYQNRKATEEEIKKWWIQWPNANIGVVTGRLSDIVVIDVDGNEALKKARENNINSPVKSFSGNGEHLWYRYPATKIESKRIWQGKKEHEEIFLRSDDLYIVAPPSIHPNGKRYRWVDTVSNVGKLPPFPITLTAFNVPTGLDTGSKPKQDSRLIEALEKLKNGHVHNNLVSILGWFRRNNFSVDDTYALLKPYAFENGKPFEGLRAKIEEIWTRYEPPANNVSIPSISTEAADAESVEDFFETKEEVKWIIPGLIAANSLGFVVGLPETSKTWALMDLAIETAKGGTWLQAFPAKQLKVWFIDQERFRGETKRRFQALFAAKNLKSKDTPNLKINSGNTTFKLDLDHSYIAFRKRMEIIKPELVIIDSFATIHGKEENNRKDIQEVLERFKALRNEFNCTFLFIHHENKFSYESKDEGREPTLKEMSGNIAIPAAAETVITMRKRIDGSSIVYHTKSTMSKQHLPFEIRVNDLEGPEKIEVKGYI